MEAKSACADLKNDVQDVNNLTGELMNSEHGNKMAGAVVKVSQKATSHMRGISRILLNQMQIVASVLASIKWSPDMPQFFIDVLYILRQLVRFDMPSLLSSLDCAQNESISTGMPPIYKWFVNIVAMCVCVAGFFLVSSFFYDDGGLGSEEMQQKMKNATKCACCCRESCEKRNVRMYTKHQARKQKFAKRCGCGDPSVKTKLAMQTAYVTVTYVWLLNSLVAGFLAAFDCSPVDESSTKSTSRLIMNVDIKCGDSFLSRWVNMMGVPLVYSGQGYCLMIGRVFAAVFFTLGFPYVLSKILSLPWKKKKWWDNKQNRARWEWAVADYDKPEALSTYLNGDREERENDAIGRRVSIRMRIAMSWEACVLLTKLLMTAGEVVMFSENRFIMHVSTMGCILILQLIVQPYEDNQGGESCCSRRKEDLIAIMFAICDLLGIISAYTGNATLQVVFVLSLFFVLLLVMGLFAFSFRERIHAMKAGVANDSSSNLSPSFMFEKLAAPRKQKILVAPALVIIWILRVMAFVVCGRKVKKNEENEETEEEKKKEKEESPILTPNEVRTWGNENRSSATKIVPVDCVQTSRRKSRPALSMERGQSEVML